MEIQKPRIEGLLHRVFDLMGLIASLISFKFFILSHMEPYGSLLAYLTFEFDNNCLLSGDELS